MTTEISAKVRAHSISPCGGELFTLECTYPRFIHAEIMTHRAFSKNAASSRAIPIDKMLARIENDPVVPLVWGKNQKGMQGGDELEGDERQRAVDRWLNGRYQAVKCARSLQELGLHKQIVNRVTEPWMWITIIMSGTDWPNLDGLRIHPAAEPHFFDLAKKIKAARDASTPRYLAAGEWHLPFIDWDDEIDQAIAADDLPKISLARCARVSYLTHDGKRDPQADLDLYNRLIEQRPAHATPSEHVAQALDWPQWSSIQGGNVYSLRDVVVERRRERNGRPSAMDMENETALGELTSGNFLGFRQYRKTLAHENIGGLMP